MIQFCFLVFRAECILSKMKELNANVDVSAVTSLGAVVDGCDVVVACDLAAAKALELAAAARQRKAKFTAASCPGLFAIIFNDFGDAFEVSDVNGEQPISAPVEDIDEDGVVTCRDEQRSVNVNAVKQQTVAPPRSRQSQPTGGNECLTPSKR